MGPIWGPLGSCRPQMGPTLTPWTLLSGSVSEKSQIYHRDPTTWLHMLYHRRLSYGSLTRCAKLRVAQAPGMPGTFSPRHRLEWKLLVSDPGMHHALAVMYVRIANPRWRGKRSRHSRRMRNPQFCVSGKRPIALLHNRCVRMNSSILPNVEIGNLVRHGIHIINQSVYDKHHKSLIIPRQLSLSMIERKSTESYIRHVLIPLGLTRVQYMTLATSMTRHLYFWQSMYNKPDHVILWEHFPHYWPLWGESSTGLFCPYPTGSLRWRRDNHIMTSWHGNVFGVTDPLWSESTRHRWVILIKGR